MITSVVKAGYCFSYKSLNVGKVCFPFSSCYSLDNFTIITALVMNQLILIVVARINSLEHLGNNQHS